MSTRSTPSSALNKKDFSEVALDLLGPERFLSHQLLSETLRDPFGGVAEYTAFVDTLQELIELVTVAIKYDVTYVVLGGGTGTLVSEVGYPGLVIINRSNNINFAENGSQVVVDSGTTNDRLINTAAARTLGGLEFLAAIPGSVGGAVASGASWSDKGIRKFVKEIRVFVPGPKENEVVTVTAAQLPGELTSPLLFPESKHPPIILTVRLQMAKIAESEIMRRLLLIRRLTHRHRQPERLGGIFVPLLSESKVPPAELQKLRLPEGLQIDRKDPDLLLYRSSKTSTADIRQAIDQIAELAKYYGCELESRLTYLGYWPNAEGNETAQADA